VAAGVSRAPENFIRGGTFPNQVYFMQELICNIEFDKEDDEFVAKLRTEMGGLREYNGVTFEEVLNMVMIELQEEFS
jgi:hypothetical protein